MKVLFDTSVLVAAIVEPHPMHSRAFPWLRKAKAGEFDLIVASHTVAELYAVLTALPVKPNILPGPALRLINENVITLAKVVSISSADYISTIKNMAELSLSGGIIYDALIVKVARKLSVDRLLTFNANDFKRVWPDSETTIYIP